MAFLDKKERILDIVLTDKGRELMSKNQLNFVYYAFSDEGVDYSGSLSSSAATSSSFDNYIHKDLTFEADQRHNRDLSSFLYTLPQGKRVLPEFRLNVSTTSSIELDRNYYIDTIILQNRPRASTQKPLDVIVRATVQKKTKKERVKKYVKDQKTKKVWYHFFGVKFKKK